MGYTIRAVQYWCLKRGKRGSEQEIFSSSQLYWIPKRMKTYVVETTAFRICQDKMEA